MLGPGAVTVRVLLAVGLGAVIGIERELKDKAAGLRTQAIISLGACLFALISVDAFHAQGDPGRVAAQIVTGVGFLGAGAIIRSGFSVKGLTTAATIWVTAAVGTACGVGYEWPAAVVTAADVGSIILLGIVRRFIRRYGVDQEAIVLTTEADADITPVLDVINRGDVRLDHLSVHKDPEGDSRRIMVQVKNERPERVRRLVDELCRLPGVIDVEWEE